MDAFPDHLSSTLVPVKLPEKPEAMEYMARHGGVKAFIIYQEPKNMRVFAEFLDGQWPSKGTFLDNFKRTLLEAKQENYFDPDALQWEKISKGLMRNPDRHLKNADKRLGFLYQNVFIVKRCFTFGHRQVKPGHVHVIQTSQVPMVVYELPEGSHYSRSAPNLYRRSFEPFDQMLYHRYVLEPHSTYAIPAKTRYLLMTVQKTVFAVDILPDSILPELPQHGFEVKDFHAVKVYGQKVYTVPPPTPAHQEKRCEPRKKRKIHSFKKPASVEPSILTEPMDWRPQPFLLNHPPEPECFTHPPEPECSTHLPECSTHQILESFSLQPEHCTIPLAHEEPIVPAEQLEPSITTLDRGYEQLMTTLFQEPAEPHTMFLHNEELLNFLTEFERELNSEPLDLTLPKTPQTKRKYPMGFEPQMPLNLCLRG